MLYVNSVPDDGMPMSIPATEGIMVAPPFDPLAWNVRVDVSNDPVSVATTSVPDCRIVMITPAFALAGMARLAKAQARRKIGRRRVWIGAGFGPSGSETVVFIVTPEGGSEV
jgi:hypothetical protein